jgi:hypothetical protein
MRNAERGASQIPLVICIVLLLVAAFFAYNQYSERESIQKRLDDIVGAATSPSAPSPSDADIKQAIRFANGVGREQKQRLLEVVEVTGCRDEENPELVVSPAKLRATVQKLLDALDKGNTFAIEFAADRYLEDNANQGGIKVAENAGKVTVRYPGSKELRGASPDMTNVMEYVVLKAMSAMIFDIKRYRDAYDAALSAKEKEAEARKADIAAKDAEIRAKQEELAAQVASAQQALSEAKRQASDAEAAKQSIETESNARVAAITAERDHYRSELEKASGQVQVLKARKRAIETDTSPDGTILSVSERQDFAVIDLGKKDNNLLPGTNFEVYGIGKGGQRIPKGTVKVTKVDATSSNCTVLMVLDRFTPIAPGDKIMSLLYSPKEIIHVALVGRFVRMGKSDAARRLQNIGVVVDEKVGIHTTYIVVGEPEDENQPLQETTEFKTAEIYGIPHITEAELSRFTMY